MPCESAETLRAYNRSEHCPLSPCVCHVTAAFLDGVFTPIDNVCSGRAIEVFPLRPRCMHDAAPVQRPGRGPRCETRVCGDTDSALGCGALCLSQSLCVGVGVARTGRCAAVRERAPARATCAKDRSRRIRVQAISEGSYFLETK